MNTAKLKAAALAATPGRFGDRIDGSGSIKYRCVGADGSLVLLTDHKNNEYGFVGENGEADELFFRLCTPESVLGLIAALDAAEKRNAELSESHSKLRDTMAAIHNTIRTDGAYTPLAAILNASKRAHEESAVVAAGINLETGGEA